ncbi:MAG: hypothetical protein COU82_00585 [Candidatus Portnoybacteria bacterium CG10_big_fil_rev_8_21_14_0_10_38_18]|uniref:Uncharacterized protein n=1 Tax=Candidatus Portnoybacteria bacterium CG10_big_fil_rev_8_21_14_0_10_38_18 TaxID=1974813 RepID=A0A2M8KCR5_9BACT|nr:MAG: hypothetical protein COU82_00585 [Candidatus Portnoybacteria bacterium CG10_big_fil_rev_8_21_14_0_10_38_18]
MKKGEWVKWVKENNRWPYLLVEDLNKKKAEYGEGPFEIIDVIRKPEMPDIVFIDKNGNEARVCSLWFETVLLEENSNSSVN